MVSRAGPYLRSVSHADDEWALSVRERLTVAEIRALCDAVRAALARGVRSLTIDMQEVSATDAAGLAALLQSHRIAGLAGARFIVAPGPEAEAQLVDARIVDELEIVRGPAGRHPTGDRLEPAVGPAVIAAAGRVALRQPTIADVATFRVWGADGFVDQMVGSQLLYRCRHLPGDDPELLAAIAYDPRAVTAVVESPPGEGRPLGFVRLHEVDLIAGFAFLETVVVEPRALRRGVGIEASRLLLAWAMDALAIRRIEAKVYAYNVLSINALRRNGFQQEGVLREARMYEQQPWDILVFSILDREMRRERRAEHFPSFALFPEREEWPA